MPKRLVYRHKNCGGFILPDLENSFAGMEFGYCPECNKRKLTINDYDSIEEDEDTTLYTINNKSTGEFLLYSDGNNEHTIIFESEEQANKFAEENLLDNYEVKPNVALYCDHAPVTNGRMIIGKEEN